MAGVNQEDLWMELNEALIEAARKHAEVAEKNGMRLPAEIPGFPNLFIANTDDPTVAAMSAIKSGSGVSYKIGTQKDAEPALS